MAYPTVSAPYGVLPQNLIGGQVYAGSTRQYPIAYNYGTNIFYGDLVTLGTSGSTAGFIIPSSTNTSLTSKGTVGVFLGCSYTNPTTKQKLFSQYYPASTAAGDIQAIVADDPDTVFKMAAVASSSSNVISSFPSAMVGLNAVENTPVGSTTTGNSGAGLVAANTTVAVGSGGAFRILSLVPDTQITSSAVFVSTTTTSFVVSGLTVGQVIPVGTDLFQILGGQAQQLGVGANVATAATVTTTGNTTLTISAAVTTTPTAGATIVLVQSPEVLVKLNFGVHNYYAA
jgi:hypothetical protein